MSLTIDDAKRDISLAQRAFGDYQAELVRFQQAVGRFDWQTADSAHIRAVGFLEDYLDGVCQANRCIEAVNGGG